MSNSVVSQSDLTNEEKKRGKKPVQKKVLQQGHVLRITLHLNLNLNVSAVGGGSALGREVGVLQRAKDWQFPVPMKSNII